jgi:hypothetical protein
MRKPTRRRNNTLRTFASLPIRVVCQPAGRMSEA